MAKFPLFKANVQQRFSANMPKNYAFRRFCLNFTQSVGHPPWFYTSLKQYN
jgi:hypothetical protein